MPLFYGILSHLKNDMDAGHKETCRHAVKDPVILPLFQTAHKRDLKLNSCSFDHAQIFLWDIVQVSAIQT